jgi:hypothetical protein
LLPDGREHSGSDPNDLNGSQYRGHVRGQRPRQVSPRPCGDGADLSLRLPARCTGSTDGDLRDAAALSLGVYSRVAAVALALFVAFVSLAFVQFWSIERPADARVMVRNLFIGNVAIVSGLLYVAVAGAGQLALLDI